MFRRLGLLIGGAWVMLTTTLLANAGNLTGENFLDIALLPALVVYALGAGLTWTLSALFR